MRTRTLLVPLALLILLAGCTAEPPSAPTATPSAPESTGEPDPTTVGIEIGATEVSIVDSDGGRVAYDYLTAGETLVAAFTEAFGTEPEQVPYPGHTEAPPGTDFVWGGFTLRVQDFEPIPPSDSDPGVVNIGYVVSAPTVAGVAVTSNGVAVGDPASALAVCPNSAGEEFPDEQGVIITWRCLDWASRGVDPDGMELFDSVMARVTVDTGLVFQIVALGHNYGV